MSQSTPITLANCESEPIHIPSAIQPHGVLLAARGDELRLSQVSANVSLLAGKDPAEVLGTRLADHVDAESMERVATALARPSLREANPVRLRANAGACFDAILHRAGDVLVVEAEPTTLTTPEARRPEGFDPRLRSSALRLQTARTPAELMTSASEEVRRLTGFDRVMVYRFDEEWNGEVVAESKRDDLGTFLGQHYPASDIPAQARRLYTLNWLRFIGDASYVSIPLVPALDPATNAPLDMTYSTLRSVSPIHLEYMRNMGVRASMSISLVVNGKLEGLIACHHYAGPRVVPSSVRDTAEYLASILSWQLAIVEMATRQRLTGEARLHESEIVSSIASASELADGLDTPALMALTGATGAAVVLAEATRRLGNTPKPETLRAIIDWLQSKEHDVFATHHLEKDIPGMEGVRDVAGGLLAVAVSRELGEYILWFRPAVEQVVRWAGEPVKAVAGVVPPRLSPRGSFEQWLQVIEGRSEPWAPWHVDAASSLRRLLLGGVRARAVHLRSVNARLLAADRAKDTFIATVSHELRTPLNAIAGWSKLLLQEKGGSPKERRGLEVIARNVDVQVGLIEDLLDISRITSGKLSLAVEHIDLPAVVESAIDACMLAVDAKGLTLNRRIAHDVASIRGDSLRIRQIVTNLLTNAVKFTPKGGSIDVALVHDGSDVLIEVRDSGQGIDPSFIPHIFEAFRQQDDGLARKTSGLGLGLAIVKKLVELHGGKISAGNLSERGGAVFRVLLPVSSVAPPRGDEAVESPDAMSVGEAAAILTGVRVLVVEDVDDSRDFLAFVLEGAGANVTVMSEARGALKLLATQPFDVIVSDIGMPEMDGLSFLRAVRAELPEPARRTPAVALSAYTRSLDRTTALQAGFQAHVAKPVEREELLLVVKSLVSRSDAPPAPLI